MESTSHDGAGATDDIDANIDRDLPEVRHRAVDPLVGVINGDGRGRRDACCMNRHRGRYREQAEEQSEQTSVHWNLRLKLRVLLDGSRGSQCLPPRARVSRTTNQSIAVRDPFEAAHPV